MKIRTLLILMLCFHFSLAQKLQSPSEFLGYELGTHFSRHHQVTSYFEHLAAQAPDRVKLQQYGTTYEGRPLLVAFISSPDNIKNLETIRTRHIASASGIPGANKAIVWMSYNVHGNESVSTEASMRTAFELLTDDADQLENTVVVIDPCINPDGRDRYVNWYNQFGNSPYQTDLNSKEHHEPWLNGRPNHYMFDLNRDWVWITQKESRERLQLFTQWLPHVHVDFHEQGMNNPYYFAPAAEPLHEVITDWQKDFQVTLGKNHAKHFDREGWLYFTKERFDLLYPSYGDTYPTYNGGIGMTYEQGGSGRAGLGVITAIGDTLTLKDRIAHHFTTGMSTVTVASQNAPKLIEEFTAFYQNKDFTYRSYILQGNPDKIEALTDLLDAHKITYGYTDKPVKGFSYDEDHTLNNNDQKLIVSTDQLKGTLVKVLFEPETKLNDSITYDITAWSLPYAYGLNTVASKSIIKPNPNTPQDNWTTVHVDTGGTDMSYGWIADWNSMKDARFLAELLKQGIRVRYNEEPFSQEGSEQIFDRGSLIILKGDNPGLDLWPVLEKATEKFKKDLFLATSGYVASGFDFGSPSVKMIQAPKVAAYSGGSTSTLGFGEVWHFFEQQLHYPISVLDESYFNRVNLDDYDVLILPNMWALEKAHLEKIKSWVREGGKLIAIGNALSALDGDDDFSLVTTKPEDKEGEEHSTPQPYNSAEREAIKELITGAIYKAKVDPTHPLAFGYGNTYHTLKLSATSYQWLDSGNAVYLEKEVAPVAGFVGSAALQKQGSSFIFASENMGRGTVIYMADNPLFRGFWENGKLFFANALFMTGN